MKSLLLFLVTVNCFVSFGQSVNLGTTYFRNDQYLISFDKILYPGYVLKIENIKKREYLLGKLILDTSYSNTLTTEMEKYEKSYIYDFSIENYGDFPCISIGSEECFYVEGSVSIAGNAISNENYSGLQENFNHFSSTSATTKRMNKAINKVEVIKIETAVDIQTNQIVQVETLLDSRNIAVNEITDKEGNVYSTTIIGDQTWMAENLRSTIFNDGTQIPVMSESQWANSTAAGIVNKSAEGVFYNFYTLISEKNVCPQGFHVPQDEDISDLYNYITPYGDHLKISGSTVREKVYSPVLAPILIPVFSSFNLAWWSLKLGLVTGVASVAVASDLILFSSELALSPVFGWRTKNYQYKDNLKKAKKYQFIDQNGIPINLNTETSEFKLTSLKPIHVKDWNNFQIIRVTDDEQVEYVTDNVSIDSLKKSHVDYSYKLKFKPFNIPGTNKFWSTTAFIFEDFDFSDISQTSLNILPYSSVNLDYYPSTKYSSSLGNRFNYQPVLTLLLNNRNDEFANQFGFNLNFDNYISFPNTRNNRKGEFSYENKDFKTGITYVNDYNFPGYFGFTRKMPRESHELNIILNTLYETDLDSPDIYRIQTRVRCVQD